METAIKDLLKSKGMTQTALAEATGVSRSHMSEIISGNGNPSVTLLRAIADVLSVDIPDLFAKPATGFAEAAVTPLDLSGSNSSASLAHVVAPDIVTPEYYRINRDMIALGLLSGDVLIVEKTNKAQNGDMVVVNVIDPDTQESETELRRVAMPWLVGDMTAQEPLVSMESDDQSRAIHGVVRGSVRGPGLDQLTSDAA